MKETKYRRRSGKQEEKTRRWRIEIGRGGDVGTGSDVRRGKEEDEDENTEVKEHGLQWKQEDGEWGEN